MKSRSYNSFGRKRGLIAREVKWVIFGLIFLAIAAAAQTPAASFNSEWEGLTDGQIRRLNAGEIVILDKDQSTGKEAQRFIQAAIIFDQPVDTVWKLFRQTERQAQYLPHLYKAVKVEDQGISDKVDFLLKFSLIKIDYRVQHNFDPANYYFYWSLDPGHKNDLKRLEGYWKLFKIDDSRTLARYGTIVNTSGLIPKSIQEYLTRKDLPQSLEAVKKYINSSGEYKKPG